MIKDETTGTVHVIVLLVLIIAYYNDYVTDFSSGLKGSPTFLQAHLHVVAPLKELSVTAGVPKTVATILTPMFRCQKCS